MHEDRDPPDDPSTRSRSKKRKIERACDFCRKRKTRCDGPQTKDGVCTNCIENGRACSYIEDSRPRCPPKAYVNSLEDRVEKMEALLKRLRPDADFSGELGPPIPRGSWRTDQPDPSTQLKRSRPRSANSASSSLTPPPQSKPSLIPVPTTIYSDIDTTAQRHKLSNRISSIVVPSDSTFHSSYRTIHHSGSLPGLEIRDRTQSDEFSDVSDDEDMGGPSLESGPKRLMLQGLQPPRYNNLQFTHVADNQWRLHGKSSYFKLIDETREFRKQYLETLRAPQQRYISSHSGENAYRRLQFWTSPPWEIAYEGDSLGPRALPPGVMKNMPPPDLALRLIELYFVHTNDLFPLLHRPTFDRLWFQGLQSRDVWFAAVCLSLFGVASRWSKDTRVLPAGTFVDPSNDDDEAWTLAGRSYIETALEIHRRYRSLLTPPNLFEIQSIPIIAQYMRGTTLHPFSWMFICTGIRKAQDVGVHRRKVYGSKPTVVEELWKRAMWHLVGFDRIGSMMTGRPCSSREEDFDLDLPLEVDDEYWETDDPALAFKQPPGKPSKIAHYIWWIKLTQIAALALRTLYAITKSKVPLGLVGPGWREEILQQLNAAMLDWAQNLPEHLRWSPSMPESIFASQAATLHTTYHLLQILIHRPFIIIPRGIFRGGLTSAHHLGASGCRKLSDSALSICVNSARACAHILDTQTQRGMSNINNVIHTAFVCCGVLLIHWWGTIAKGGVPESTDSPSDRDRSLFLQDIIQDLSRLMNMLDTVGKRWEEAAEMLEEIKGSLPNVSYASSIEAQDSAAPPTQGQEPYRPPADYPPTAPSLLSLYMPSIFEGVVPAESSSRSTLPGIELQDTLYLPTDYVPQASFPWETPEAQASFPPSQQFNPLAAPYLQNLQWLQMQNLGSAHEQSHHHHDMPDARGSFEELVSGPSNRSAASSTRRSQSGERAGARLLERRISLPSGHIANAQGQLYHSTHDRYN